MLCSVCIYTGISEKVRGTRTLHDAFKKADKKMYADNANVKLGKEGALWKKRQS